MKEEKYRMVMMLLLSLGIILFIIAIIVLAKNIEEIKNDPMLYGMDKHEFVFCTCLMEDGQFTMLMEDGQSTMIELSKFKNNEG